MVQMTVGRAKRRESIWAVVQLRFIIIIFAQGMNGIENVGLIVCFVRVKFLLFVAEIRIQLRRQFNQIAEFSKQTTKKKKSLVCLIIPQHPSIDITMAQLKSGSIFLETLGGELMSDDEDFFSDSDSENDDQDLAPIPSSPTTEEETPTSATIHSSKREENAKQPLTLKERKKLQKQKQQQQQKTGETIDENENESLQHLEQQALIEKVSKSIMYYHLTEHSNRIVSVDSLHPSWSTRIRRNMLNQLKKFHGTRTIFNKDGTTTTTRTSMMATTEATPTATETKNEGKKHNDKKTNNEDLRNSGKSSGSDRVKNHQNRIEKVDKMSQNLRQGSKQWNNNNSHTKTDRNTNNNNRTSATEKKSFTNNQKNTATATTITTTATKATPEVFVHPSIIEKRKQRDLLGSTNWSGKKIVFGKPKSSTTSASKQS